MQNCSLLGEGAVIPFTDLKLLHTDHTKSENLDFSFFNFTKGLKSTFLKKNYKVDENHFCPNL